jgi:hypothetical protein
MVEAITFNCGCNARAVNELLTGSLGLAEPWHQDETICLAWMEKRWFMQDGSR